MLRPDASWRNVHRVLLLDYYPFKKKKQHLSKEASCYSCMQIKNKGRLLCSTLQGFSYKVLDSSVGSQPLLVPPLKQSDVLYVIRVKHSFIVVQSKHQIKLTRQRGRSVSKSETFCMLLPFSRREYQAVDLIFAKYFNLPLPQN